MPRTPVPYCVNKSRQSGAGRQERVGNFFGKFLGTRRRRRSFTDNRSECPLGLAPLRRSFLAAPFILCCRSNYGHSKRRLGKPRRRATSQLDRRLRLRSRRSARLAGGAGGRVVAILIE